MQQWIVQNTTFAVFLVRLWGLKNDKKGFFACVAETTVKRSTKMLDYSWQLLFLFLFQMLLFKVCIAVVSPFIYVFAQYYGATVLSHYCSLHYLFLDTKFPILLAAFWAVFPTLSLRHKTCVTPSQWHDLFQMAGIITCLADDWLFITIKQVDYRIYSRISRPRV